ncbi:pyridoxamine 5'-phosphate oxidase family protein [uncultured Desulfovibrio sp.]|uniref:pyridoxamine 5'-phosphate oxidase family protein n=1 Tax=uncultured Desulfovibrio sp. TaxID=167968 RepID=UPI002618BA4E|nr:pyridoxamine 5'-phosphate oxidase family protein [uncultured Desulfovibrio sp.]
MQAKLRTDAAFYDDVFAKLETLYVSFSGEEYPYVLPLNAVWLDGHLYAHTGLKGHKLDCLARDARVGFAGAVDVTIAREHSTAYFRSISGHGRMSLVTDDAEKIRVLDAMSDHYQARCPRPTPPAALRRVNVLRIDIEEMCGKDRLPD